MREIKFRFWSGSKMFFDLESVMECLKQQLSFNQGNKFPIPYDHVGLHGAAFLEFTGLLDTSGVEIFEGDVIRWRVPHRTTQTHTGDNIPNGSYTEPMEPGIKDYGGAVTFHDGAFCIEDDDNRYGGGMCPISHIQREWDAESIQSAIWCRGEIWDDPEEGDLQYLIMLAGVQTQEELINYLNMEVIGNIYANPDLLKQ